MKNLSIILRILTLKLLLFTSFFAYSQIVPPQNLFVTPVGTATWDSIENNNFQFYKIFLDGVFIADTESTNYQFGSNGEELTAGETYLAEISALYYDSLSEKIGFEFVYLPCDSFSNYNSIDAFNQDGTNDIVVTWSDMLPMELIEINQAYGESEGKLFQQFGFGYGVSYDFTSYPDALIHAVDFRHSSWGNNGTWDFTIHIINRDVNNIIASVGPFQTTGEDTWEEMLELGDVPINGANEVAILMEPMGNLATDAYPRLDSDNAVESQGSIFGDLSDLNNLTSSDVGNFLMDIHIYTANSGKSETDHIGTNVYLDDELLSFVPIPDTFYIIEDFPLYGYHDICIDKVYTNDEGNHSWTSCSGELCEQDIGAGWPCNPPQQFLANDGWNSMILEWNDPNQISIWLQYDDGINIDGIGGPDEFWYAVKWTEDQLSDIDGAQIKSIKYFPKDSITNLNLMIWEGENTNNLIYQEQISSINYGEWNVFELNEPLSINPNNDLWVGFKVISTKYAAGCGQFTGNQNSDLISLDGNTWERLADYGLDYSWNLGFFIEADSSPFSPIGYNVYKDGVQINEELITEYYYEDQDWELNIPYCYYATAIYEECGESDASNVSCAAVYDNIKELNSFCRIYPNPAQSHCKIESAQTISSIKIYNQLGQSLFNEQLNTNEFQIDLAQFEDGIYIIEIKSNNQIQKSKLMVRH